MLIKNLNELFKNLNIQNNNIVLYLKNNYNYSIDDNIFNITPGEFEKLKNKLDTNNHLERTLCNFIDDEIILTQKENQIHNLNEEIIQIDNEIESNKNISSLYSMATGEYEEIKHWDMIFNIGDINDIEINQIIENENYDYGSIIGNVIGENDYKKDLSKEDKEFLNQLFTKLKTYYKINNLKDKGNLKTFLNTHKDGFQKFIINEINSI